MASIGSALTLAVIMFVLTPGVIISIPPGPNKLWITGGQVTWSNAIVHSLVFAMVAYYFF
jgi:hypothetical protein